MRIFLCLKKINIEFGQAVNTKFNLFFRVRIISIILGSIICSQELSSQSHDFIYEREIEVFVKPSKDNNYSVSSITKTKIKFVSERSRDVMTFNIPSAYIQKVSKIKYSFDGESYGKSDVKSINPTARDVLISDDMIYQIKLPKVPKIGDVLYYEYQTDFYSYVFLGSISIPNYDSVAKFTINVQHPDSINPSFTIVPVQHEINYTVDSTDKENTKLIINGITYGKQLEYYNANQTSGEVIFSIKKDGKELLPISPAGILEWYSNLTPIQPRLDDADKTILFDTLSKQKSELDKVHIIYDYVRKNFRYSSEDIKLSGYVPRKPSEILKSKFADCKERATLISAIAAEHNIPIQYVLFPNEEAPESAIAYPQKFNHVINLYTGKNDTVYFDATSRDCPFGVLPEREIDGRVVVLENNNSRWDLLEETNIQPGVSIKIDAKMDSLKSTKGKLILRKQVFIYYLEMKKELSPAKLETTLSFYLSLGLNKIRLEDIKEESISEDSVVLSARVDLSSFIIKTTKNNYAPVNAFSLWDASIIKRKEDQLPVVLKSRFNSEIIIFLSAPDSKIKTQEIQFGNENQLKFLASATGIDSGTIKLTYSMFQKHRIYQPNDKQIFLEFYEKYTNNRTNMFLLGENNAQKDITR